MLWLTRSETSWACAAGLNGGASELAPVLDNTGADMNVTLTVGDSFDDSNVNMDDRNYLKSDLTKRGWTPALIARFLGGPDETPHRYGGGHYCLYAIDRVTAAEDSAEWRAAIEHHIIRSERPPKEIDLLVACWTVSRSAKRYRDMAQTCYRRRKHGFAGEARRQKDHLYTLKDRGIVAAHLSGRIAPVSLVGDGLVEYRGEGFCFHSFLCPKGVNLPSSCNGQPLLVEAKPKEAREPRLRDAVHTLEALPEVPDSFERLVPKWQIIREQEREQRQEQNRRNREHWQQLRSMERGEPGNNEEEDDDGQIMW